MNANLNRFPTIFTPIKWMISFVIPDDGLKATGLNWNSGLGV